jgi:hypothetical protein
METNEQAHNLLALASVCEGGPSDLADRVVQWLPAEHFRLILRWIRFCLLQR